MREPVMFLASPCRRLDVVQGAYWLAPRSFGGHFGELGVLDHHGVHDAEEGFVAGEEPRSSGECVALQHSLTGVFGKDLDDTSALAARGDIPLEITAGFLEDGVQLVGDQFVRREDAECFWVPVINSALVSIW